MAFGWLLGFGGGVIVIATVRWFLYRCRWFQLAAVKEDGFAIKFIESPCLEVQLAAVKQYGYVIKFIESPSLEVQLEAVRQNGEVIDIIENPCEEVLLLGLAALSNKYPYMAEVLADPGCRIVGNKLYCSEVLARKFGGPTACCPPWLVVTD